MYETLPPYVYSMGGSSCHSLSRKKGRERGTHLLPFPGGKREDNFLPTQEERRGRKTAAKKEEQELKTHLKKQFLKYFCYFLEYTVSKILFLTLTKIVFF